MSKDDASSRPEADDEPTSPEAYTDSPMLMSILFFLVPLLVVMAIALSGGLR